MNKEKRKVLVANLRPLGEVFNITPKVFEAGGKQYSQLADRLEVTYDYDLEKYNSLIGETEILVGWEFPRDEIEEVAPNLRWIHLMGSGLDQCLPLDWLPENVLLTTSAGAHAVKAGEFMATALMMLNNNVLQFITNQNRQHFQSIYSSPIAGKTVILIGALETGHWGGAIMVVENPDQVAWNPQLWTTPNLLIITHCVTNDPPNFPKHIIEVFFRNLDGYLRDEPMATQVGREREY